MEFASGDIPLHGIVLIPEGPGPFPAIVLVHGAGPRVATDYRDIAEAFAGEGFLTLMYDKRTVGYSGSPVGPRSYALLAQDVVAAVRTLQERPDVNPTAVGVWGLSEGGWVAPLAAAHYPDIAFVITVAGGGIGPARQTAWSVQNALRSSGVTSGTTLWALTENAYSMLVVMGLFPEGRFDPVPVLTQMQQPILAIWGADDTVMPPGTSMGWMQRTLEASGHESYTLRVIPEGDHEVRVASDSGSMTFAPGYISLMATWMRSVVAGEAPPPSADAAPRGEPPVPLVTRELALWLAGAQALLFLGMQLLLLGSVAVGRLVRLGEATSRPPGFHRWLSRLIAAMTLVVTWGVYAAVGYVASTAGNGIGPVVAGRPLFWLVLQAAAVVATVALIVLLVTWRKYTQSTTRTSLVLQFRLVAGGLLIPWAMWWNLFSP